MFLLVLVQKDSPESSALRVLILARTLGSRDKVLFLHVRFRLQRLGFSPMPVEHLNRRISHTGSLVVRIGFCGILQYTFQPLYGVVVSPSRMQRVWLEALEVERVVNIGA